MEATRVTVDEIRKRMENGEPFTFIDARNPKASGEARETLPGAIRVPADEVINHLSEIPQDRVIITEASQNPWLTEYAVGTRK